jgi:predicted Fe-S protein YdhL (DUF1289 family)
MTTEAVPSPCVSICVLDEGDTCQGCFRTAAEITDWLRLSDDDKRRVLASCDARRRQSGLLL